MTTSSDIPTDLIQTLKAVSSIAVLTGAGTSAESGVPTFRDALTGLWSRFRPEELATPEAFAASPERVSHWYDERRRLALQCMPNAGHTALVRLEDWCTSRKVGFSLITQNVDRLHQRAGNAAVTELHGDLFTWRCVACGIERIESDGAFATYPPRCECGGMRRPGVVWFGEHLPVEALDDAKRAAARCDLFIAIGTSAVVYPAAGLIESAVQHGAAYVEINLDATPLASLARWALRRTFASVMPGIMEQLM